MQIVHRISINSTPSIQRELAALRVFGGEGDPTVSRLVTFEVKESDQAWPAVREWIIRRKALDVVSTTFSAEELSEAAWLELRADWHYGYPQPDERNFGYLAATYDLSDFCGQCGIGLKQKAPFQMKGEPKWGRNNILQLNWVFDEYFVRPEIWVNVFEPQGIRSRPVFNARDGTLRSVVQLVIDDEVSMATNGLSAERCQTCGRVKYLPVTKGMFPALMHKPSGAMVRTQEYFGSGASAYRAVVVSAAIASSLASAKVRGASLRPVARW